MYRIMCQHCHTEADPDVPARVCAACGGPLGFSYDYARAQLDRGGTRSMWRFADLLPLRDERHVVTLDEGGTPLLPSRLELGCVVYLKDETRNPTGSQKDRALSVALSKAREFNVPATLVVSTGSVALSCAAYAARAGIPCGVVMTKDAPPERVFPVAALGATIFQVAGSIEEGIALLQHACTQYGLYEASTYRRGNPYQNEGIKTIGFEMYLDLGRVPDWIVVPVGGGGTIAAIWRAFRELHAMELIDRLPRMAGVQPRHYNALEMALQRGLVTEDELASLPFDNVPPTILVKLQHTILPDGAEALASIRDSGGALVTVSDEEALEAQARLGAADGLYVEPSSAVILPAIEQLRREGRITAGHTVVACITGSGFRETTVSMALQPPHPITITPEDGLRIFATFAQHPSHAFGTIVGR